MSAVAEFPVIETFAQHVAANIRAAAARRGVTQTDLAEVLGLTQSVISQRYRGKREWSLHEIEAVARYLRTTTSALCAIRDSNPEPADLESEGLVIDLAAWQAEHEAKAS